MARLSARTMLLCAFHTASQHFHPATIERRGRLASNGKSSCLRSVFTRISSQLPSHTVNKAPNNNGPNFIRANLRTECSRVDAKEKFYCILQSNRVKDERILENYSPESGSQEGLGLNPKRMIVKILSSFTCFDCRML